MEHFPILGPASVETMTTEGAFSQTALRPLSVFLPPFQQHSPIHHTAPSLTSPEREGLHVHHSVKGF